MAGQAQKKRAKENATFKTRAISGVVLVQAWYALYEGYWYADAPFSGSFFLTWAYFLVAFAIILWWLFLNMADESIGKLIKTGWTSTCFDSLIIICITQVLGAFTAWAWYLLAFVPLLVALQAMKMCSAAKQLFGGLAGAGASEQDDAATQKRNAKKQRQQEMRARRHGGRQ